MARVQLHIIVVSVLFVAFTGAARAQFDLMTARAQDKVAASKYFTISNDQVTTFDPSNLARPISTTSGRTLVVERVQRSTAVDRVDAAPGHFALSQNFPNPFNMSTKIVYSVPVRSTVSLIVYDMLGRETAVLLKGEVDGGSHAVDFMKNDIASGTYFYRLAAVDQAGATHVEMKKMILLK